MNRDGDILKTTIDNSKYTIAQVIDITKVSRGQLYSLFGKEKIKDEWRKKFEPLKLNIDWTQKSTESTGIGTKKVNPGENAYKAAFEAMVRAMAIIEKDHAILSAIVEGAVKEGSLKIIKNPADVRKT